MFLHSHSFLRVEYHDKRHHIGVVLQVEKFLCFALVVCKVTVKNFLLWLKYCCEVFDHSAHVDVRQVNKNNRSIRLYLALDYSAELVHIGIHCELDVERSLEYLREVVASYFRSHKLVDGHFVVRGKFITEHTFDRLQEMYVEIHVLVVTIQVAWFVVAVKLTWLKFQLFSYLLVAYFKNLVLALVPHQS